MVAEDWYNVGKMLAQYRTSITSLVTVGFPLNVLNVLYSELENTTLTTVQ